MGISQEVRKEERVAVDDLEAAHLARRRPDQLQELMNELPKAIGEW